MNLKGRIYLRFFTVLLTLFVWFGISTHVRSEDIGSMNALDALGIDSSVMPEGFDEFADNPYGRDLISINPVYELFITHAHTIVNEVPKDPEDPEGPKEILYEYELQNELYGHNDPLGVDMETFYAEQKKSQPITPNFVPLAATVSASGNFIGENANGKTGQIVTVGVGQLDKNGGLYLYFSDPVTQALSPHKKTLLSTDKTIGNTGSLMTEDFYESPYLMQNYLKIATGDFDNSGIDEIAVYVAEQGRSRVEIYKLHTTAEAGDDFYLNPDNWKKEWTFFFHEAPFVSNMVSIITGDFNRNGIDDLALTWGYYYGSEPGQSNASQAVIMYGDNERMLQTRKNIPLIYNNTEIVRAAFAYGDISGDNVKELILGGQLASDIAAGNLNSRFIGVYAYDGHHDRFLQTTAKNFDFFERDDDGRYVHPVMDTRHPVHQDRYFSVPATPANIATVNLEGMGKRSSIYLDSFLYQFDDEGVELSIAATLDNHASFNKRISNSINDRTRAYYIEYGIVSGDFTGDALESIQLMQYYFPYRLVIPQYLRWWFIRIIVGVDIEESDGELDMLGLYEKNDAFAVKRTEDIEFSTSFCKLNSDHDTAIMRFTGQHYITYTDPKILAVLLSPPYFSDLSHDGLSGNYMSSETSYSESTGTGTGVVTSHTVSAGAYVSFEQEFSIFGISVAKFETELAYKASWTWEFAQQEMMEQTITFSTEAGSDAVAFYSIPMETYVFESITPVIDEDGNITGYDTQKATINIPHTAAVQVLPLDTYERIAADYVELPQLSGDVLTHTVGDPATYPHSTAGYPVTVLYDGDPAMVGYGHGSITQELAMSVEKANTFTQQHAVDFKIGAGAGGVVVGVTAGYEYASGEVSISTEGSSYVGQLYNMPIEAQPYGYSYKWRIFAYPQTISIHTFPVVSYMVQETIAPPKLPVDFQQDITHTTDDQIALTWSYKGNVAGFQLYRYYEFPDGSGSYELAFVRAADLIDADEDGTRYYRYIDTGLHPYTDYAYQIQTIGSIPPFESMPSRVYTFRTKSSVGYPTTSLKGLVNGQLHVYPDSISSVQVIVENMYDYSQTPRYQWQQHTAEGWADISGAIGDQYTFRSSGFADEGLYRCRINVIYEDYHISAYSDEFMLTYSMRTPRVVDGSFQVTDVTVNGQQRPRFQIALQSAHAVHSYEPMGTIIFEVTGSDYRRAFPVDLQLGSNGQSYADFVPDGPLPEGAYLVTAHYAGSRVYQSLTIDTPIPYLSGSTGGYVLTINRQYTYGDDIHPQLLLLEKEDGQTVFVPITQDIRYKVIRSYLERDGFVLRYVQQEEPAFTPNASVTAAKTGEFRLVAYVNDHEVAYRDFSVEQRELVVFIIDQADTTGNHDLSHPDDSILYVDELLTPMAYDDTIADLGLAVAAFNSAGTQVLIEYDVQTDTGIDPGLYLITGTPGDTTDVFDYYRISYMPGTYIITGQTYKVHGFAQRLHNMAVGTIEILSPEGHDGDTWKTEYSHGTNLVFLADPYTGYDVKKWTVKDMTDETNPVVMRTEDGGRILNHQMTGENILVSVEFEVGQKTLQFAPATEHTGTVVCINDVITSGSVAMPGASFTFKAIPAKGYHFVQWQLYQEGQSPEIPETIITDEGAITCTLSMGSANTRLYALFARDSYRLTLQGHLQAEYWVLPEIEGDDKIRKVAISGDLIQGDLEVKVEPKPGYTIPSLAQWAHDESPVSADTDSQNQTYTFIMTADTTIAVETQVEHYDIVCSVTGPGSSENQIFASVNDIEVDPLALFSIEGGSKLVFTAQPAYGYRFVEWMVNGEPASSAHTLTIGALGGALSIEAVFEDNTAYTIHMDFKDQHGKVFFVLNDNEPVLLAANENISVFLGDTVSIIAQPNPNFMVRYWVIDGKTIQSHTKTQTFGNISTDHTVRLEFVPQSYATVTYEVHPQAPQSGGQFIEATSDGIPFPSGNNSIGNGTMLTFVVEPDTGMMVKKWTHNDAVVENKYGRPLVDSTYLIEALSGHADIVVHFEPIQLLEVFIEDNHTVTDATYSPDFEGKLRHGAAAIFTAEPEKGYRITSVDVLGHDGLQELGGFDDRTVNDEGLWTVSVYEAKNDLTITATAKKLHSVTVPSMPLGGSITVSTDQAIEGEDVTIQAIPSTGYVFRNWVVTAEDEQTGVAVVNIGDKKTFFSMPDCDVTVTANFSRIYTQPAPIQPIVTPSVIGTATVHIGNQTIPVNVSLVNDTVKIDLDDDAIQTLMAGQDEPSLIFDLSDLPAFANLELTMHGKWFTQEPMVSDLTIIGPYEVTIHSQLLQNMGVTSDSMVTIGIELGSITLYAKADGKLLTAFDLMYPIRVRYSYDQPSHPLIVMVDERTGKPLPFSLSQEDGFVSFITPHFGTFFASMHSLPFTDLEGHWAKDYVAFTTAREIFMGTGQTSFSPDMAMTRAMFVTVLGRLAGIAEDQYETSDFTDVPLGLWYSPYVQWASQENIVQGYGDGRFGPNDLITREQMAVMLMRWMRYTDRTLSYTADHIDFDDQGSISGWALLDVSDAQRYGLILGKQNNRFDPQGTATRAEVATILTRFIYRSMR